MKTVLFSATAIILSGCASAPQIYTAQDATLRRGGSIQLFPMTQDPLGGAPRLVAALAIRGFDVREGAGQNNATHSLRLTYSVGANHATGSCTLAHRTTGKIEVSVVMNSIRTAAGAANTCADAILAAAK